MKRLAIFLTVAFLISLNLYAVPLDEIVVKAKQESSVYRDALNLAKKSDYSAELLALDKEHTFTLGVEKGTWTGNENDRNSTSSSVGFTPFFRYSNAEDNTTTVSVTSPIAIKYRNDGLTDESTYSPSVGLTQKVLINGVKDNRLDLQKKLARLEANSTIEKVELQFEITLYNAMLSVLTKEGAYLKAEATYNEKKALFDSNVASSLIEEGTYAYKSEEMPIITLYNTMNNAKTALQNAVNDFERIAGFEWQDIDNIDNIELSFDINLDGNTTIKSAKINMESAKNEYDVLTKNDDRILTFNADSGLNIKGDTLTEWSLGGGVSYSDNNWNAKLGASGAFNSGNDWKGTPTVDFGLTYSLGTNTDETKRLKIQNALLNLQNKTYEYNNAMFNYKTDAENMKTNIMVKTEEAREAFMSYENAKDDFENAKRLNESGYYTPLSFKTEQANFKAKENAYKCSLLSLYILNNESKILNI